MKLLALALLLAFVAGSSAAPASAFPIIEVTACDTLSLDPLRVRTTFDISSQYGAAYSDLVIHPDPPRFERGGEEVLNFFDCTSPPGWHCDRYPTEPYLIFVPDDFWWTGERVTGFSIVSNRAFPCVVMIFGHVVLGEEYGLRACLQCDAPVPAKPESWGSLKARYR